MRRDATKKFGNRHRSGWPMEFETHRTMVFDQAQAPEAYARGYEAMERRCYQCGARCLGDDGLREHHWKVHAEPVQEFWKTQLQQQDGPPAVFEKTRLTLPGEPQAAAPSTPKPESKR